jgi:zinc-ribbon domain
VTERYCRNCGHELAETDRFCPNCGTPVHQGAHVPTPEADVDVPSPPQKAGATTPPPDEVEGREEFPVAFFTVVAAIGGSVSAALLWAASQSATGDYISVSYWPLLLAFAIFLGALLPGVFGFAFGFSLRGLRPLPAHLAGLAIGTLVFGMICLFTVKKIVTKLPIAEALELLPETVFIPAIAALTTAMFYMSSSFIGRAWRRQKAGEPSRASTSVREASDQPQTPRQQATARLSGEETWTPRQQAIVGLIGTIAAALIGLFGVLVQVLLPD